MRSLLVTSLLIVAGCSGFKAVDKHDLGAQSDLGVGVGGNGGAGGSGGGGSGGNGGGVSDGGVSDGDGGTVNVGGGGGTTSTGAIACGNTFCRADETCSNGACTFPCTGTRVPGDYATIQAAVDVLEAMSGASTICLAAQAYHESVNVSISSTASLTILGQSPAQTSIDSVTVEQSTLGNTVTLRGFTTSALTAVAYGQAATSSPMWSLAVTRLAVTGPTKVTLFTADSGLYGPVFDGDDLAGGLWIDLPTESIAGTQLAGIIANSYVHGAADCVQITDSAVDTSPSGTLTLLNNTIDGCQIGLDYAIVKNGIATLSLTYQNNIIANQSQTGVVFSGASPRTLAMENNALYGNGSNFSGTTDGTNDVKSDCKLDGETPPAPGSGSPCRGAGEPSVAPSHDYWGAPRTTTMADIGAVQTR